jgi:DNA repair protein RecN (Recombination protein N)
MLKNLLIKNYALIEHLEMAPSPELNIITGETGAGKSIMLGAIGLLLGRRADLKTLYNESKKCIIEGVFDVSEYNLQNLFEEEDLDYEVTTIIRREINPNGKSRAFINDSPVYLETLKSIGNYLMDIHSQNDTLLLASNQFQLTLIDSYAQNRQQKKEFQDTYRKFVLDKKNFENLKKSSEELKKEEDFNNFLWEELSSARLAADEQQQLEEELNKLENAEEIKIRLNEALQYLSQSEYAAQSTLYNANSALSHISEYDHHYLELKQRVESCLIDIKDIAEEISREESLVDHDPEKIGSVQDRLNNIYKLQQKHRVNTIQELLVIQIELEEKLQKVQNLDEELDKLKKEVEISRNVMEGKAKDLSESRQAVFSQFISEISLLLKDLGMPDASLEINHKITETSLQGIDQIEILFSANKGIKPQEMKQVASGGEFSRLMFCIKYILADKSSLPTIIFDEIDTGISGEIAIKMVNMMKKMASEHQIIAISHLPQIAAKGNSHYFVYKDNSADKTMSKIKQLTEAERIEAIAMMIGGDNPTPVAFENARELMD